LWVTIDLASPHWVLSHSPRGSVIFGRHATITWIKGFWMGGPIIRIR